MIDPVVPQEFLAQHRFAVVGASDDPKSFARTIYQELKAHGHDVVAVHPTATTVGGDPAYASLADVPGALDGAVVMVNAAAAPGVVRECIASGIPRVWLFRGLGGPGALSDEAVQLCREHGLAVVEGACPLMFLEPVGWFHRLHRTVRHVNRSLAKAS